jgi:hypothetical protein
VSPSPPRCGRRNSPSRRREHLDVEKSMQPGSNAVLVSVESMASLRKGIPELLLDTDRFVEAANAATGNPGTVTSFRKQRGDRRCASQGISSSDGTESFGTSSSTPIRTAVRCSVSPQPGGPLQSRLLNCLLSSMERLFWLIPNAQIPAACGRQPSPADRQPS